MDAKYQDLHISSNRTCYNPVGSVIKRGITLDRIIFYDKHVVIVYYENDIRYEMEIPKNKLELKSIIID